jgi:hypothetical protein
MFQRGMQGAPPSMCIYNLQCLIVLYFFFLVHQNLLRKRSDHQQRDV